MALAAVELTGAPDQVRRIELLLSHGEAEGRAGDIDVTREVFFKAATLAQERRNAVYAGAGGARLQRASAMGSGGQRRARRPVAAGSAPLLGGDDDQLRVRLLTRLACSWRSNPEQHPLSDALSEQAVELARRLGDPATLAYALIGRFYATWWPRTAVTAPLWPTRSPSWPRSSATASCSSRPAC